MFAPPVAKPKAKTASNDISPLHRATPFGRRHGDVEQAPMFGPLPQVGASLNAHGTPEQDVGPASMSAKGGPPRPSWNFCNVPAYLPGREKPFPMPPGLAPRLPIQAKLKVGAVNDPLEHEADRVADQVMRMPTPGGVSAAAAPPQVSRKCAGCEEEEKLQQKPAGTEPAAGEAPASVHEVLRSPGQPLDAATLDFFEPRFGRDLSAVRLHTGGEVESAAHEISARAFTVGSDIAFAAGEYRPETCNGQRLLAHELAHVVQGDNRSGQTIKRQACGHDAPKGAGCGRLQAQRGEDLVEFGADRVIAEGIHLHFPGTWIGQVYTPPNPVKKGEKYGLVDAMKVTADRDLVLDVIEVKSRNIAEGTGGCALATREAQGYVSVLQPLAPRMAAISKGLEKIGGLSLPDCRKFNKSIDAQLKAAGVDTANEQDMFAWCVLNSIQQKTRKPVTKGFDSVSFRTSMEGEANISYLALTLPYPCKVKGKPGIGTYRMFYQVNKTGGLSYRCEKTCQPQDDKEKEKQKELKKQVELDTGQRVETFEVEPIGDEDPKENVDIREPGTGIDVTDVAIYGTATVAAAAALHLAFKRAKTKAEQEIARKGLERLALEAERRGAAEVAKTLDSKNLSKLGTEAYEKILVEAEKKAAKRLAEAGEERIAKKLATKLGEKAAKKGAKTLLEKGSKAIPYLGLLITVYELGSAADAYAKGADIEFGISGSDVDLSGATKVDVKGEKGKGGVTSDVKLTDTQIDMDVATPPDAAGIVELEAKKATIKGKMPTAEGSKLTVNLNVKLENVTITYTSIGRLKGGNIVIDGALDIKDATIEIDIPEGTEVDVPQGEATKRQIKGIKVKITKPGSGAGDVGSAKEGGKGEAKGGTKASPPDPEAAERAKLLNEIQADASLKKIYETYFTKKGTPAVETLRRLAAVKARLKTHPELLEKIVGQLKPAGGEVKDPIKEFIEPLERALDAAEKPAEAKTGDPQTPTPGDKPSTAPSAKKDAPAGQGMPATEAENVNAMTLEFWKIIKDENLKNFDLDKDVNVPAAPTPASKIPVLLTLKTAKGNREYHFYIHGTLVKARDASNVSQKFEWSGDYTFYPPADAVKSTQGDEPIKFSDASAGRTLEWGLLRKKKHTPKKK